MIVVLNLSFIKKRKTLIERTEKITLIVVFNQCVNSMKISMNERK